MQLFGTEATISCTVTGLTKELDSIEWTTSSSVPVTTNQGTVTDGGFLTANGSHTITLTIPGTLNIFNQTYVCLFSSNEHRVTNQTAVVKSQIYSEYEDTNYYKCSLSVFEIIRVTKLGMGSFYNLDK